MSTTHMRSLLGAVAAGAFATACAVADASPSTCPDDRGCSDGFVCAFGLCVDPADQRLSTVDIEIDGGGGIPVQTEFAVDLKARPRVDITLAPGVLVTGEVQTPSGEGLEPVDAVVVAQPLRSVAGRVVAPSATTNSEGVFELLAVEGERYLMTISPASELPPLYDERLDAEADEGSLMTLEDPIVVDAGAFTLTGVVRAGEGAAEQGVEALEVRLTDEATRRRVSSTTRTAADGSFTLRLREPGTYTLEVLPTVDNQGYPRVATQIDLADVEGTVELAPISLGDVLTPPRFEARVVDSDGNPVPGATLSVRGAVGNGEFTAVIVADADGRIISSVMPPATYEALVYGPPESATGGLFVEDQLDVPSTNADLVFTLPPRVSFNGTVLDPDGSALPGAALTFLRVNNVDEERDPVVADTLIEFAAISDASGQFDVAVDPGQYRVTIRPPAGNASPFSSELHTVTEAGRSGDLALPARAFVAGVVNGPNGPVPSAFVRVFSLFPDERGAAIPLGEGVAGPDGVFEIVVSDEVTGTQTPDPP